MRKMLFALSIVCVLVALPPTPIRAATLPGLITFDTSDHQVFVINPDGSGKKKIADGNSPLFSPEGNRVAFLSGLFAPAPSPIVIKSYGLATGDIRDECVLGLSSPNAGAYRALVRWSPAGKYIAFLTTQNGPGSISLCDTTTHTVVPNLHYVQGDVAGIFDWSADGSTVLYQASPQYGQDFELYVGDPDAIGAGATQVTQGKNRFGSSGNYSGSYRAARLSPDGTTIALAGDALQLLSVPGSTSAVAGKSPNVFAASLAWSPDNKALATGGTFGLTVVDLVQDQYLVIAIDATTVDWTRSSSSINGSPSTTPSGTVATDFAAFAHGWSHHGYGLLVASDGSAREDYRTYTECGPTRPADIPCEDPYVSNAAHTTIQLTSVNRNVATGKIVASNYPKNEAVGDPVTLTLQPYDMAEIRVGSTMVVTLCGPNYYRLAPASVRQQSLCGA